MITKELETNKMCLFCASEYHLEMILLPYIKERINDSKFIIFTEKDLNETLNVLLTKINLDEKVKKQIKELNWKKEDNLKFDELKKILKNNKEINIIINGEYNYIETVNNNIKPLINDNIKIIDCFHVGDPNVDIDDIKRNYKCILNTQKIKK